MTASQNVSSFKTMTPADTLKSLYGHMQQGNWTVVERLLSEDFVVYEARSLPYSDEWKGIDGLKHLHAVVMASFMDPSIEIDEFIGGQEWAAALVHFTVTSRKTGRRFTQTVSEVGSVIDGKLVELRIHYFDAAEI